MSFKDLSSDSITDIMSYLDKYTLMTLRIVSRDLMKIYNKVSERCLMFHDIEIYPKVPKESYVFISYENVTILPKKDYNICMQLTLYDNKNYFVYSVPEISKRIGYIICEIPTGLFYGISNGLTFKLNISDNFNAHEETEDHYYSGSSIFQMDIVRQTIKNCFGTIVYKFELESRHGL